MNYLPTVQDGVLHLVAGAPIDQQGSLSLEAIPWEWIIVNFIMLYIGGLYPCSIMREAGYKLLLATGNQGPWWLSKIVWLGACTVFLYCLMMLSAWLVVEFMHGSFYGNVSLALLEYLNIDLINLIDGELTIWPPFWLSCVTLFLLLVIQFGFASFVSLPFAYIASSILMLVGLFFMQPLLLSNWLMAVRSSCLCSDGLSFLHGVVIIFSALGVVIGLGFYVSKKTDAFSKDLK